ncbi:SH3 domain-containing kinase-binding protein 1 isoform X2 [Anarrhichthys ocellatus]|uniref:SH3 domain-containing kinase-binding protein 1 isoform X2 n=1 Tax=Anarrhichthys ocellatus TaxID=433405 RepID=UPI0012EE9AF4|nr:SH3 domain-containing kinase-binding protein 1-like isoform X2 [Anarrhichthys ocellatus]
MDGVALPQMLLYLTGVAGQTRCRLKDSAGFSVFHSLHLCSPLSRWAAIAQPSFLVTLMMEERKENQSEEPDSSTPQENSQETLPNGSALPAAAPKSVPMQSFTSLLPKALSAVLHQAAPPGLNSDRPPSRHPPNLEQLQTDLRDLRDQFELMKTQHNKEIKLLMNELDEEKRIRLTLQVYRKKKQRNSRECCFVLLCYYE